MKLVSAANLPPIPPRSKRNQVRYDILGHMITAHALPAPALPKAFPPQPYNHSPPTAHIHRFIVRDRTSGTRPFAIHPNFRTAVKFADMRAQKAIFYTKNDTRLISVGTSTSHHFAHSSPHVAISKACLGRAGISSPVEHIWSPNRPVARL